jgi:putative ABC transport system substrate-binding protein
VLNPARKAFRVTLAELGYAEGQNVVVDERYAQGQRERVPQLVTELMTLRVRVLVAVGPYILKVASRDAATIPIVAIDLESDPVAAGFVASLARPGGHVTGTFLDQAELSGKWLQLLREMNPKLSRVAAIWDSSTPPYQLDALKASAKSISIGTETLEIATRDDFKNAFDAASRSHAEALVILSSPLVSDSGTLVASLSNARHLPTVSMFRENVLAGCLMSYGPSLLDGWRRIASYVARILNGANAGELPVERPAKFELVINLKTAKALGLTIPPSLLLRADEVIQ